MPLINSSFTVRVRNLAAVSSLHAYLAERFTYHPEEEWRRLIEAGFIFHNERPGESNTPVNNGDVLRYQVVDYEEPDVPTDYRIVSRDEAVMVVHKPAGLPVHRTGRIFFQTLVNLIREELEDPAWSPLHRLDRETGGLMAFARGKDACSAYSPERGDMRWLKLYTAVLSRPLSESRGVLRHSLAEDKEGPIRSRMIPSDPGKPCVTLFRVVAESQGRQLVVLAPLTGRKHQLRAQLAAVGNPIVGDKIYGQGGRAFLKVVSGESLDEADWSRLGARHQLLHAFHLRLEKGARRVAEATDWDWSEEFTPYFPKETLAAFTATEEYADLIREIEEMRESPAVR